MTTVTAPPPLKAPRHVTYVRLGSIRPAVRNAKMHDIRRIKASLVRHGLADVCGTVDERTQRLVGGHGRLEAIASIRADGSPLPDGLLLDDDGEWLVPVFRGYTSRNDAEAEALNIQLNRLTELGGWHNMTLAQMLESINGDDPSLFDDLGFSADEMDDLLRRTNGGEGKEAPEIGEPVGSGEQGGFDAGDLDGDGTTGGPPEEGRAKVKCPECHHRFVPGDR